MTTTDTWTFFEGDWHPGNHPIMGPRTHAAWLGTTVFDGARAFDGAIARSRSPHAAHQRVGHELFAEAGRLPSNNGIALAQEGVARFEPDAELYIRPMYWPEHGAAGGRRAVRSGFDAMVLVHLPRAAPRGRPAWR